MGFHLSDNIISENSADEYGGGTIEAINNIIWDNPAEQDMEVYMTGGSINFNYCDLKGGQAAISVISPGSYTWGAGMIEGDPRVDAGASHGVPAGCHRFVAHESLCG